MLQKADARASDRLATATGPLVRFLNIIRSQLVLVLVVALGFAAGGSITLFQLHSDASRRAQSTIGAVKFTLADLQAAPFAADRVPVARPPTRGVRSPPTRHPSHATFRS